MAKFKVKKKLVLQIIGVIILLAAMAGAGVLVWWLQQKNSSTNNTSQNSYSKEKEEPSSTVAEAQTLALKGDPAAAQQKIDEALKNASSSKDKQQFYLQQGVIYENAGDNQKALQSYLDAEKNQSDAIVSGLLGQVYEKLGNKTKALEYYKKELTQMDVNAPSYNIDKPILEQKIKSLGG